MGDAAERARSTVTWRIRNAIKKLEPAHPALARHLGHSIKTGVFCSYTPGEGNALVGVAPWLGARSQPDLGLLRNTGSDPRESRSSAETRRGR